MQGKSGGRIRIRNGYLKTEDDAEVSEVLFALVTHDERHTKHVTVDFKGRNRITGTIVHLAEPSHSHSKQGLYSR
jgi:hypothetical protein